jgi:hypothetical protein
MRKIKALCLLLLAFHCSWSQEKLEADRPGESRTPELVKGNHFQGEFGFRKEKLDAGIHLYHHPSARIRYGLFNAIELRAEITSQTLRNSVSKETRNGLAPIQFGIKGKILPEYKGFPSLALLGQVGIPKLSSEDFYDGRLPVELRALFGNRLGKQVKLQYNAGVKWHDDNRQAQWMYSFSPVFEVSEKFNVFLEEYAFFGKTESAEHYVDGGLEYYISNNFMFDFSAGAGLSENSSPYFVAVGASFRLSVR